MKFIHSMKNVFFFHSKNGQNVLVDLILGILGLFITVFDEFKFGSSPKILVSNMEHMQYLRYSPFCLFAAQIKLGFICLFLQYINRMVLSSNLFSEKHTVKTLKYIRETFCGKSE